MAPERGFSLVEVVAVLAIIAVASVAVVPALLEDRQDSAAAAAEILHVLHRARAISLQQNVGVTLTIDPSSGRYWIGVSADSVVQQLARGQIGSAREVHLISPSPRHRYHFTPVGTATGEPLRIESSSGEWSIEVEPWTGEPRAVRD